MVAPFDQERLTFCRAVPDADALQVIYAFPNTYSVGITSLGYQMIWGLLANRRDVQVTRLFTDAQEPLPREPQLVGFSFSWELDYGHVLDLLEKLGIPLLAQQRGEGDPMVFGGGPVLTANPEPYADFFDLVLLGDGEILIPDLIETVKRIRGLPRKQRLRQLAQVPGFYVPQLYQPLYAGPRDPVLAIEPLDGEIPRTVMKQTWRGTRLSVSTVVTPLAAWESIFMVEVVRSCPEMCRFCLASYLTLPFRVAAVADHLLPAIEQGLGLTRRIGLLGASITQHPQFEEVLEWLAQDRFADVQLSLASVRTSTVTTRLAQVLSQRGSRSLTVAIESGSERLRQIMNKKLRNEEIVAAAVAAYEGGLSGMKFYGMVGVPGEEEEDWRATVGLFRELKGQTPRLRYTLGCSTFVPKAHTPWQRYGVRREGEKGLQFYQRSLRPLGVEFRPESYRDSLVQALLSRGDRRLSQVLLQVRQWGDGLGSYKRAFKELVLPPFEYYVFQDWDREACLPWDHLRTALSPERIDQDDPLGNGVRA